MTVGFFHRFATMNEKMIREPNTYMRYVFSIVGFQTSAGCRYCTDASKPISLATDLGDFDKSAL